MRSPDSLVTALVESVDRASALALIKTFTKRELAAVADLCHVDMDLHSTREIHALILADAGHDDPS